MPKLLAELPRSVDILAQVLCYLPKAHDDNLIVGLETSDDAVYKINDELALIQTLDFHAHR